MSPSPSPPSLPLSQATVPALIDLAAQLPAAKEGLAELLKQLMLIKASEPFSMTMVRDQQGPALYWRYLCVPEDLPACLINEVLLEDPKEIIQGFPYTIDTTAGKSFHHHPHIRTPLPPGQLSRAFESFGRFLALRQDLVAPLVSACLSTMMLLPLEQPGHLPPPTPITAVWKRKFDARLSMCAAVSVLAKVGAGQQGKQTSLGHQMSPILSQIRLA